MTRWSRAEKKNLVFSSQTAGGSRLSADFWLRFREEEQGEEGEGRAEQQQRGAEGEESQWMEGGREEEEQSERREAEGRAAAEDDRKDDRHKLAEYQRKSS